MTLLHRGHYSTPPFACLRIRCGNLLQERAVRICRGCCRGNLPLIFAVAVCSEILLGYMVREFAAGFAVRICLDCLRWVFFLYM